MLAELPKVSLLDATGSSWISSGFWKYIPGLASGDVFYISLPIVAFDRQTHKKRRV